MKSVTITSIPDKVFSELATRAALRRLSLQEYLRRELVALSSRPDVANWVALIRSEKAAAPVVFGVSEIPAARDSDRR